MIRLRLVPGSLRARMALALSLLFTAATVAAIGWFTPRVVRAELDAQRALALQLLQQLEPPALQLLSLPADRAVPPELDGILQAIAAQPAIDHAHIRDHRGETLYFFARQPEPPAPLTRWLAPHTVLPDPLTAVVHDARGRRAHLELGLSTAPLNDGIRKLVAEGALFLGALLAVLLAVTYALLSRFTAPLKPLTDIAREVSRGNWSPRVQLADSGSREIRELNQAFAAGTASVRHTIRNLEETRELLAHREQRLRKLVNGMHEILFELDADGDLSFLNPAWERLTGFTVEESLGRRFAEFLPEPEGAALFGGVRLERLRERHRELALRTRSGKALWVTLDADAQHDRDGRFTGVIGTLGDITQSVELNRLLTRYQEDLYHLSITDPLTGLYNRRHFDTRLEVILADQLPRGHSVALLLIDVDCFKFINDTYGHPAGDEALRTVARLLVEDGDAGRYVARLAGDEFAVVLRDTDIDEAQPLARGLHDRINAGRIQLPVGQVQLQCSIGVAVAPLHGGSAQDLVSAADVALYHAKRGGRNRVEVLSPDNSRALRSIFSQGFELRRALEQGNLLPAFQPICDIDSGRPVAYEALARMQHGGALVKAGDFIQVAEELGLTREIDLHIIDQALRLAPRGYGLFLNLDPSSFGDRGFARELGALLEPACRAGRAVTIEITERETVSACDALLEDIGYLRSLGCTLALDDFGSGYSTYHFLNLFRPEYLKIEGAFVRGMIDRDADRKIVEHIHDLASAFGARTIAESVENEATRAALARIGIRNAQGSHLGAPLLSGEH